MRAPGAGPRALPLVDAAPTVGGGRASAADGPPRTTGASDPERRDLHADDLIALLTDFYDRIGADPTLAPYFVALDMATHIPRIADFWATIVFHADRYRGNAFAPHRAMPGLTPGHFTRWLAVFEATVDARHVGPAADQAKEAAYRIAYSMQLRLGLAPSVDA